MDSGKFYNLKEKILKQDEQLDVIALQLLVLSKLNDLSDDYDFCDFNEIKGIAERVYPVLENSILSENIDLQFEDLADEYYSSIEANNNELDISENFEL